MYKYAKKSRKNMGVYASKILQKEVWSVELFTKKKLKIICKSIYSSLLNIG